jgi:hypothetical protein
MESPNPYQTPAGQGSETSSPSRPRPGSGLDFGRCLGFFFQDPDWVKKIVLGSLFTVLSMFMVGVFFLAGYLIRLVRRSAAGEERPLPEWDDLGGIFVDGALVVGAYLVYLLPLIVLMVLFSVGVAVFGGGIDEGVDQAALAVGSVLFAVVWSLILLVFMLYLPAALVRLALERRFGSAFEIEKNFEFIKRNVGNYVLALLVFLLANFISQFGILLFCIGILPASFWGSCVGAYALGEVALRDPAGTAIMERS